jgi:hypothetical protein
VRNFSEKVGCGGIGVFVGFFGEVRVAGRGFFVVKLWSFAW